MKQLENEESTDEEDIEEEEDAEKPPEEKFYDICQNENEKNVSKKADSWIVKCVKQLNGDHYQIYFSSITGVKGVLY